MMPTVSVVIPTYNSAPFVVRAVESALAQTIEDVEVLVIDDGSEDGTADALHPYLDRIRYLSQPNSGRSVARNHGIDLARGTYIAFLDADDWWHPNKLSQQTRILESSRDTVLVHTGFRLVGPTGRMRLWTSTAENQEVIQPAFERLIFRNVIGSPSSVLVRRQPLLDVGGFNESLSGTEDWDLWLRLTVERPIGYIDEPLTYYQLHDGSIIERIISRNVQRDWPRIVEGIFEQPRVAELYQHLKRPAMARVLLRLAFLDCYAGNAADCSRKIAKAVKLSPDLAAVPLEEFGTLAIEFANEFDPDTAPVSSALRFLKDLWSRLPSSLEVQAPKYLRLLQSRLCAERFFKAYSQHDWAAVRRYGWRTVKLQTSWLRNLGFVSIWLESLLGSSVMSKARSGTSVLRRPRS